MNKAEFDALYRSKNATNEFLERIFKPEKYPEFHAYLDGVHEEWINSFRVKT